MAKVGVACFGMADWTLKRSEFDTLLLCTFRAVLTRSLVKKLPNPLKILESHRHRIGSRSFTTGLYVILIEACRQGQSQLVSYILQYHSKLFDIDRVFKYEFTDHRVDVSLTASLQISRTLTIISVLNEYDVVSIISRSNTLLHLAVENDHLDIVQILIKAGARINATNCCGRTPLMLGVKSFQVTKLLLSSGAEANAQDKWGSTALLIAVDCGVSPATILLLLENGADHKICNKSGHSFLHKVYGTKTCIVDYSGVLEEKKLSLTCTKSGLLVCDGVPLCTAPVERSLLEDLDENPFLGTEVQLSLKYLKPALYLMNMAFHFPTDYRTALCDALEFKAKHNLLIEYPSIGTYKRRHEVTNSSELASLSNSELVYQNLMVIERVAGYGSYITIWLIIDTLWKKDKRTLKLTRSQEDLYILQQGINMLRYRMEEYGIEKRNAILIQELTDLLRLTTPAPCFLEMASQLLSCIKLQLKMFEKAHGHHSVPVSSERSYRYADFRGELLKMTLSGLSLLMEMKRSRLSVHGLMSDFLEEMPLIVSAYDEVLTPLSLAINHYHISLVKLMLECGGDKWIHTRVLQGDFPISLILQRKSCYKTKLTGDEIALVECLLDYGMHADCVDSKGCPLFKALPPQLHRIPLEAAAGSVLPLSCICAQAIVTGKICYWTGSLPPRIVDFVAWHDSRAYSRQLGKIFDLP